MRPSSRSSDRSTVVCLGGGPSLTQRDIDACRGATVIAINTTYKKAPWANVLYAADKEWWEWHAFAQDFEGLKVSIEPRHRAADIHGIWTFRNTGPDGLETRPFGLRTGRNSGYQAINLAVHLGARRIILLGYDMQPGPDGAHHHHAAHPGDSHVHYEKALPGFSSLVAPLQSLGIPIVNCSRATALTAFPTARLEDTL